MSVKTKFYHIYGNAKDKNGIDHVVTVVGKYEQRRQKTEIKEDVQVETKPKCFVNGELRYSIKMLSRKLTLGVSICHPSDEFNEETGVEIAKSRIEKHQDLGTIMTNDVTMLTEDAIMAELLVKLQHITENIDEYIS